MKDIIPPLSNVQIIRGQLDADATLAATVEDGRTVLINVCGLGGEECAELLAFIARAINGRSRPSTN